MMNKTRICELLTIIYPILQGGMLWLADAGLAAAVSNAGGLGVLSPYAGMDRYGDPAENLNHQICMIKTLTDKPFGVNIPLDLKQSVVFIDILISKSVPIVITAAGNPADYTELLRQNGARVMHVVSSVKQAKKAEKSGADVIVAEGVEAGGHLGFDEIPLFSLLPQVVDAVSIPVIAAGGIVDARGLVAAMALGAEGIQMGTRFVAVKENIASDAYKHAIITAEDSGTVITSRNVVPARCLKTAFTDQLIVMEKNGATAEEIRHFIGYRKSPLAQIDGKLSEGEMFCGASAGVIKEIVSVADVIKDLIEGYQSIIENL